MSIQTGIGLGCNEYKLLYGSVKIMNVGTWMTILSVSTVQYQTLRLMIVYLAAIVIRHSQKLG